MTTYSVIVTVALVLLVIVYFIHLAFKTQQVEDLEKLLAEAKAHRGKLQQIINDLNQECSRLNIDLVKARNEVTDMEAAVNDKRRVGMLR